MTPSHFSSNLPFALVFFHCGDDTPFVFDVFDERFDGLVVVAGVFVLGLFDVGGVD